MKRVIVIGSNSFSGSDFIDLLLENGSYEVLGMSRSSEKTGLFLSYKNRDLSHFKFEQIDMNRDMDRFEKSFDEFFPITSLILQLKAKSPPAGNILTTGFKRMQ